VKEQLLKHHLGVAVEGLVDILKEEVVVGECGVCGFHKILIVLMGQAFSSREWALRI
jgi:hypothetical protein